MTHTRGKKPQPKSALQKTLDLIQSIQKMEKAGAMKIDRLHREVHLIKSLFWDGRSDAWKANFTRNLHIVMDVNLKQLLTQPIHFYEIDTATKTKSHYITTYLPELGECKEILNQTT